MHGCGKARPLSMQLCSGVHCGHISAMHLMSVQGIQESHAVEVSVAPGGQRWQLCTIVTQNGQGRLALLS